MLEEPENKLYIPSVTNLSHNYTHKQKRDNFEDVISAM